MKTIQRCLDMRCELNSTTTNAANERCRTRTSRLSSGWAFETIVFNLTPVNSIKFASLLLEYV